MIIFHRKKVEIYYNFLFNLVIKSIEENRCGDFESILKYYKKLYNIIEEVRQRRRIDYRSDARINDRVEEDRFISTLIHETLIDADYSSSLSRLKFFSKRIFSYEKRRHQLFTYMGVTHIHGSATPTENDIIEKVRKRFTLSLWNFSNVLLGRASIRNWKVVFFTKSMEELENLLKKSSEEEKVEILKRLNSALKNSKRQLAVKYALDVEFNKTLDENSKRAIDTLKYFRVEKKLIIKFREYLSRIKYQERQKIANEIRDIFRENNTQTNSNTLKIRCKTLISQYIDKNVALQKELTLRFRFLQLFSLRKTDNSHRAKNKRLKQKKNKYSPKKFL